MVSTKNNDAVVITETKVDVESQKLAFIIFWSMCAFILFIGGALIIHLSIETAKKQTACLYLCDAGAHSFFNTVERVLPPTPDFGALCLCYNQEIKYLKQW